MPNYKNAPKEINPHYNREFELLMSGEKEIAVFSTAFFADSDWPDERYENAVAKGELLSFRNVIPQGSHDIIVQYYYRPEAEEKLRKLRFYEQLDYEYSDPKASVYERDIGELLGYSDQEIDKWIEVFEIGKADDPLLSPHDGRELELMLERRKPLTKFSDFIDPKNDDAFYVRVSSEKFDPYIENGTFIRKEFIRSLHDNFGNIAKVKTIYISQQDEEWRIDEANRLDQGVYNFVDSDSMNYDRKIGELLGYTSEEINAYIKMYYG